MSIIKRHYKIALLIGILVLPLLGAGAIQATRLLTKDEEIQLKQQMKPQVPAGERTVDLIGTFAPGFEKELEQAKAQYVKEYGEGNFQVIGYHGYTLLVPFAKAEKIADVKAKIDVVIASHDKSVPSASIEASQIAKIREVFDIKGAIAYNSVIGAYTDDKGFQYNFTDGELVNKQVGITGALQTKFEQSYPHLKPGVASNAAITNEEAKNASDRIIDKAFGADRANELKANVRFEDLEGARVGIVYGDLEVQMLVDKVTGDVIHYSKVK
jgi:hypothetical protein